MTEIEFLEAEIGAWLHSDRRNWMLAGTQYYRQNMDIDSKQRTAIGEDGRSKPLRNLPNFRIGYNRYAKLVDQKINYILAKPFEVKTDNEIYGKQLDTVFNHAFRRLLKNVGVDVLNSGIAYLHPYVTNGELKFKRFPARQILPFWADEEHEVLDSFLRMYAVMVYESKQPKIIYKVEYYTVNGITYYVWDNNRLLPDVEQDDTAYLMIDDMPMNWERVPLIAFKYNMQEIPLIKRVKGLQDALNTLISNFADVMCEDIRNTILVVKNYDGTDPSELRRNLSAYGMVKVRTLDGIDGGVDTLTIEVNAENYRLIIKALEKAIIDVGHGFDASDDRMSQNPNQMNISSIYSNIDIDTNNIEMEFQSSLQQLMWFVDTYLHIRGQQSDAVEFIFNRDTPVNESEIIDNCRKSEGVISKETIIENHPWTKDTADELRRLKEEQSDALGMDYADISSMHQGAHSDE
nr:MAG TPA: PORTAL PROTEIN [Caudoviricetes sp.]